MKNMEQLQSCCRRQHVFYPQKLYCYGKELCTISKDAMYFDYQNKIYFCKECFNDISGDTVTVTVETSKFPIRIMKTLFNDTKNNRVDPEPLIVCLDCGKKYHQICVLHLETIWSDGFRCDQCMKEKGVNRKDNMFTAKHLPVTNLSSHIEIRVNNFLKEHKTGAQVNVRVLSSSDQVVEIKPGMRNVFHESNKSIAEFPYRAKSIFAFQQLDNVDVFLFGMYVQEYGSECASPNSRRIYISYFDSVHFFKPSQYRTSVYHEIILGYMDYVKQLGYAMVHVWACPPSEGDDFIFNCHPTDQKSPERRRLIKWYKTMFEKGVTEGIIEDYKNLFQRTVDDKLTSVTELPYFEDDFLPDILEEIVEQQPKRTEVVDAKWNSITDKNEESCDDKKAENSKKSSATKSRSMKNYCKQPTPNNLTKKMYAMMKKYKSVSLVVRLHSAQSVTGLSQIRDTDPLITCDLVDSRDAFIQLARDKHYEFSSLRRAKFSTLCLLYEVHTHLGYRTEENFVYSCDNCKNCVDIRYHCGVCDDYDLCTDCKEKIGHIHDMEKLGYAVYVDDSSSPSGLQQNSSKELRKQNVQKCIDSLLHACQCLDTNCKLPTCLKMKKAIMHTNLCQQKKNGCSFCKQFIALCCYHSKYCKDEKCPMPYCPHIKIKIRQQQLRTRLHQARLPSTIPSKMPPSEDLMVGETYSVRDNVSPPVMQSIPHIAGLSDQQPYSLVNEWYQRCLNANPIPPTQKIETLLQRMTHQLQKRLANFLTLNQQRRRSMLSSGSDQESVPQYGQRSSNNSQCESQSFFQQHIIQNVERTTNNSMHHRLMQSVESSALVNSRIPSTPLYDQSSASTSSVESTS